MRTFFCLELEERAKEGLARVAEELRRRSPARVTWVSRENLHITLRFLGEINPELIPELRAAAELAVDGLGRFKVRLDRLGAFPEPSRARVIWAGSTAPPQELLRLYHALEEQLEALSFPPEGKPYTPHVTLGRVKERDRAKVAALAGELGKIASFSFETEAQGLTLMESTLTPSGAIYKPVFRVEFH